MIVQTTNKPIILDVDEELEGRPIRAKLYDIDNNLLEEWDESDIVYNANIIELPLSEEITKDFPVGTASLEIKWLNADGKVEFVEPIRIYVGYRRDKSTFGGMAE